MSRMFVPAALALALAAGVAVAQNTTPNQAPPPQNGQRQFHHRHAPNPQRQADHIAKALNLSPDQTAKLTPIFAERDQKMQALWQSRQDGQQQDMRQQMHAIQKSTNEQLATVLTPDQLQQLRAMHHGRGEGPRGHHGQGTQPLTPQAPAAE